MSGEFGSYTGGYVHDQIDYAADDCQASDEPMTRLLGDILRALHPIARGVCWHEAADSGPEAPVMAAMEALPAVRAAVRAMEKHVEPYRRVAERAIRNAPAPSPEER